jgi:hypothetical protein
MTFLKRRDFLSYLLSVVFCQKKGESLPAGRFKAQSIHCYLLNEQQGANVIMSY